LASPEELNVKNFASRRRGRSRGGAGAAAAGLNPRGGAEMQSNTLMYGWAAVLAAGFFACGGVDPADVGLGDAEPEELATSTDELSSGCSRATDNDGTVLIGCVERGTLKEFKGRVKGGPGATRYSVGFYDDGDLIEYKWGVIGEGQWQQFRRRFEASGVLAVRSCEFANGAWRCFGMRRTYN
jgi:hypothetical protein